jgi:hypothetical protein|tara:strand:+ start:698 stop:904 length:207 start_codon:yes stop_codon:yes gene_type:complete
MKEKKFKEITAEKAAFLFIMNWVKEKKDRFEFRLNDLEVRQEILEKPGGVDLFLGFCYGINKNNVKGL